MAGPLEIQITREICTTVSNVMESSESSSSSMSAPAVAGERSAPTTARSIPSFPPPAHCRRSSIPSSPPPSYTGQVQSSSFDIDSANLPPPDYSKFTETSRAERCFYYGFLFCPIWLWGFMHFWNRFSTSPNTLPPKDTSLPSWIDSSTGLAVYSTPLLSPSSDIPVSPSQKTFPSWRRRSSSRSPSTFSPTVLEMNRPDVYHAWRKEERAWALRCGYAFTVTWSLLIMFLFICVQTGVFGFTFSS